MLKKIAIFVLVFSISVNCQSFVYSEDVAKNLGQFSILAYCSYNGVLLNNCGPACERCPKGFSDYNFITNTTMQAHGIIGYSPDNDAIVITFRGTLIQEIGNIIRDLQMFKTPFPYCSQVGCNVHLGFYSQFLDLKNLAEYYFKIYRTKYPNSKVYITGHSLGGAMATIAMPFFYQWNGNKKIDAFYTFSSPRVGDKIFSNWFKDQKFAVLSGRITHHLDPVVQNPSSWFPQYFYHINQEVYYPNFNLPQLGYKLCLNAEDTTCGAQQNYFFLDPNDHMNIFGWNLSTAGSQCSG